MRECMTFLAGFVLAVAAFTAIVPSEWQAVARLAADALIAEEPRPVAAEAGR